jgi:hypothetical protein
MFDKSSDFNQGFFHKERLFDKYAADIKEVRSLVNLWREEFERRMNLGIELMETVDTVGNRFCGYSECLTVKRSKLIKSMLFRHLDVEHQIAPSQNDPKRFEKLPSINFSRILAVMKLKDRIDGGAGDRLDRWNHAGIANMRQY